MSMKATDLMIGDYLQDEITGDNVLIRELSDENIMGDKITVEYLEGRNEGNIITMPLTKELKPILLTPEILKKNKFEESAIQTTIMKEQQIPPCMRYGIQLGEYSGVYISFGLPNTPIYDIRSDYRVFQGVCIYVHELQHALKLCKIDKEIRL